MKEQGIICINKPMDWTSHDVVNAVRRRLGVKRVGHTGTLDPLATGVLPVAFGKATRMIEYYEGDLKTYRAEMKLGMTTDTLDITGEVLSENDRSGITGEDVAAALGRMCGEITQIPPKYSALKVKGKPLYEYARKGIDVDIKPRKAYIEDIYDISVDINEGTAAFTVDCAKGTYIRTLCDDVGRTLGCGAVMTGLVRTASGQFSLSGSVTVEELRDMTDEDLEGHVIPVQDTLAALGTAELNGSLWKDHFLNGREIEARGYEITRPPFVPIWVDPESTLSDTYRVFDEDGEFLGTGLIDEASGVLRAEKVIAER